MNIRGPRVERVPAESREARSRVAILGHVCIDENTVEGRTAVSWGSPAVYMYRQLLLDHDAEVSIVSPYGDDFAPFAEGLPLENAPTSDRTMRYRNVIVDGVREQHCLGADDATPVAFDARIDRMLGRADFLLLCPLAPNFSPGYVAQAVSRLPREAVRILLVQGYLREIGADAVVQRRAFSEALEILPLFDVVVMSDEDLDDALVAASGWVEAVPGIRVVVTENSAGATLIEADANGHPVLRSFQVEPLAGDVVADTIGAGDVFGSEFAHAFWQTRDAASAIESANAAAGRFLVDVARTVPPLASSSVGVLGLTSE